MKTFKVETFKGYNGPNTGQHPTELVFILRGDAGAVVWRMGTGVAPTSEYYKRNYEPLYGVNIFTPTGYGLYAHSELTIENSSGEDYTLSESCSFLDGRACACTMQTGMRDKEFFQAFACEGFAGIQKLLETVYTEEYER